jgi:hypothetical protein
LGACAVLELAVEIGNNVGLLSSGLGPFCQFRVGAVNRPPGLFKSVSYHENTTFVAFYMTFPTVRGGLGREFFDRVDGNRAKGARICFHSSLDLELRSRPTSSPPGPSLHL